MKFKSAIAGLVLAALGAVSVLAQGVGQLAPGQVWGNESALQDVAAPTHGVGTNVRHAFTTTATLATTDCGKTVALGGSAFYTFTVNAASTYNAACSVIVTNEDNVCPTNGASTCRGKLLAINGYANFILWPGQTFALVNQNNVWQYSQPGRWQPLVGMTWHVNHATGSNAGDGLGTSGTGEFATMQHCIDIVESLIDFGQADIGPTCSNDNETFTENNVVHTHPLTGYHVISITGNIATPGNVTWQVSGSGNTAIQCRDTGMAIIQGFTFVSTGTGNDFIQGGQLAVCDFGSIVFGSNTNGVDIHLTPGGSANFFGGTLSITGSMNSFVKFDGEGHFLTDGATVTVPNALTIGAGFVNMPAGGAASMTSMTFSGAGLAGTTGAQFTKIQSASLNITSTTLPGNSPGQFICVPVVNVFTSGTNATYTTPTCNSVLPATVELKMVGAGGGGAGSGTTPGAATAGTATCWKASGTACTSPLYTGNGGALGITAPGTPAAGGTASGCDINISGGTGGNSGNQVNAFGGAGGSSAFGGAGGQGFATAGTAAAANSGSGGGGGGVGTTANGGGGGGSGGYCEKIITNPLSSYVYTIGAAGAAGTAGTSGFAGGAGAAGQVQAIARW
jgi:hypothetical protein